MRYFTTEEITTARAQLRARLAERDGGLGVSHLAGAFSYRYLRVYAGSAYGTDDVTCAVAHLLELATILVHGVRCLALPLPESDEELAARIVVALNAEGEGGRGAKLSPRQPLLPTGGAQMSEEALRQLYADLQRPKRERELVGAQPRRRGR